MSKLKFTYYNGNPWRKPWDRKDSMLKHPLPPKATLEDAQFLIVEGYDGDVPIYEKVMTHAGFKWAMEDAPDGTACVFGYGHLVYYVFRKVESVTPAVQRITAFLRF